MGKTAVYCSPLSPSGRYASIVISLAGACTTDFQSVDCRSIQRNGMTVIGGNTDLH
jgi:hypothetical protein